MVTSLKNLWRPPVLDDPEMAAKARSVHTILLGTFALTILFMIYAIFFPPSGQLIFTIVALILEFGLLILVQSKHIRLASGILTSMLWIVIFVMVAIYGGIRDAGFGAFAVLILIAGLTMGTRANIIFTAITILAGLGLAFAENQGFLPAYTQVSIVAVLLSHSINLIAIALLLNLAIRSIESKASKTFENNNSEEKSITLQEANQPDLNQSTVTFEKRNDSLQTIASLSRLAAHVRNEKELLEQSAKVLLEMNNLEKVGFYLIDQMEEYAILQVFRSQAGKTPANIGETLNVIRNESSSLPIGAGTLRFKIGDQNYYVVAPKLLPEMRTSLVYPLTSIDKLMGLMNIQTSSLDPQDIENQAMQMLADQIALSMANIRLRDQLQSRVQEVGALAGSAVRSAWDELGEQGNIGYAYDRLQVLPTSETFPPEVAEELRSGKTVSFLCTETPPRARLAAPIILRDAIIGVIGYESDILGNEWQNEEKALLETVASRISLALENARLFEETTRRADRERTVSEITTRIRSVSDPQVMVQTALDELKRALGTNNIQIRPYSPTPGIETSDHQPLLNKQKPSKSAEVT